MTTWAVLTPDANCAAGVERADGRSWPALDGLRALAVVAVLLFHGGFGWAQGGFLGVSTFFTLSGFLITTTLLVAEHDRSGAIADGPAASPSAACCRRPWPVSWWSSCSG